MLARPTTGGCTSQSPPASWWPPYRADALFEAHREDPEFGYRFLVDEAATAGQPMADRTAWRICSGNGWWSAFGKKRRRGKGRKVGPPVHDDLVKRDFTAQRRNQLWLADITEHHTTWIPAVVATDWTMRALVKQPCARRGCPSRAICGAGC
ncbi:hypothetical protein GCM10010124_41440 [Pilimelia terevasa]|uniref:Transposase n=1 Tax=Pilimelia terevasa TaxID=53372 RepID=A0A8J3BSE7_9ACTN|nr:hypothetical protein GCM10010124_41440 [Pilimelia terevasa]